MYVFALVTLLLEILICILSFALFFFFAGNLNVKCRESICVDLNELLLTYCLKLQYLDMSELFRLSQAVID